MKKKSPKVGKLRTLRIKATKWRKIAKLTIKIVKATLYIAKKMTTQQSDFLQPARSATTILPGRLHHNGIGTKKR